MKIAVAGGTGVVGRHVVDVARERGHDVVVLCPLRGRRPDHRGRPGRAAGGRRRRRRRHERGDPEAGCRRGVLRRRHPQPARPRGAAHVVALSIVGVDVVDTGYYAGKRLQERLLAEGDGAVERPAGDPVPRVRRAGAASSCGSGPFSLVPADAEPDRSPPARWPRRSSTSPSAGPSGRVPDLAGPEVHDLVDLARRVGERASRRPGAGARRRRRGMRSAACSRRATARAARSRSTRGSRRGDRSAGRGVRRRAAAAGAGRLRDPRQPRRGRGRRRRLLAAAGRRRRAGAGPRRGRLGDRRPWRGRLSTCSGRRACAGRRTSVRGCPSRVVDRASRTGSASTTRSATRCWSRWSG